ncbi:hypothetical protein ACOV11_14570 [Vibrio natriegens]
MTYQQIKNAKHKKAEVKTSASSWFGQLPFRYKTLQRQGKQRITSCHPNNPSTP